MLNEYKTFRMKKSQKNEVKAKCASLTQNSKMRTFVLKKMADIPIERYIKVKKNANPFDTEWDAYFEKRCKKRHRVRAA
ncbi:MAG: hypothetical protein RR413_04240 [Christensenellaceae bacterium]